MLFLKKNFIIFFLFLVSCSVNEKLNSVVVTRHYLASEIGANILKEGGNAFDSAIAVGFTLAVVNPSAGNLGGGGFTVYSKGDETFAIDYREKAPILSTENMYLDDKANVIEGLSLKSYLSSGIPGTVAGLISLHEREASLPLKYLMKPAIDLAENGFRLSKFQSGYLNKNEKKFRNNSARKIFVKKEGWKENDLLIQKDLAKSLKLISEKGKVAFYRGEIAKKIVKDFNINGGIFSLEDFASYEIKIRKPICGFYRSFEICSMPPPSSGGIAIIQILNILENFDIANYKHNSFEYVTLLKKAMAYTFADRSVFLGDSDFFDVPQYKLTSKKYAAFIAKQIKNEKVIDIKPGIFLKESSETTHFSIVDTLGNAVSNTYTLNGAYGSGIVAEGTGILMNNEMDDFSIKPGHPNLFGLIGAQANKIEPLKRPLSSMSPVIIKKDNNLYLITGSPGGSTIINSVLQEILNVIDFKMSLKESSSKSKIHYQWVPDILFYENLDDKVIKKLEKNTTLRKRKIGEIHSILKGEKGYEGFADKRRPDGKSIEIYK